MAVSTDQSNPFSATDFETGTIKKFLAGKAFLQIFYTDHKIASHFYLTRQSRFKMV